MDTRALAPLCRHAVYGPRPLSQRIGVGEQALQRAIAGQSALGVPTLRALLPVLVELGEERLALGLVAELLDLAALGWELRAAQPRASSECLLQASLRVSQEAGELAAKVIAAAEDGRVTPAEAEAICHETADVRYAADIVAAAASAHERGEP